MFLLLCRLCAVEVTLLSLCLIDPVYVLLSHANMDASAGGWVHYTYLTAEACSLKLFSFVSSVALLLVELIVETVELIIEVIDAWMSVSSSSFLACNSRLHSAIRRHHPPQRRFWAKSAASGSIRWCYFRSCWMVLSHVIRGRPGCLLQSAGGEANRILLASALLSIRIICPNKVSRRDWIIAVSLGCFVSLRTSSFHTNWYHLMLSIKS